MDREKKRERERETSSRGMVNHRRVEGEPRLSEKLAVDPLSSTFIHFLIRAADRVRQYIRKDMIYDGHCSRDVYLTPRIVLRAESERVSRRTTGSPRQRDL